MTRASTAPRNSRQRILTAAAEVLLAKGFGAASLNDFCRAAGGSKQTIYTHFDNKESLVKAAMEELLWTWAPTVSSQTEVCAPLVEQLIAYADAYVEWLSLPKTVEYWRLLVSGADRVGIGESALERLDGALAPVRRLLEREMGRGRLPPGDAAQATRLYRTLLEAQMLDLLLCGRPNGLSPEEQRRASEFAVSAFLAALRRTHLEATTTVGPPA